MVINLKICVNYYKGYEIGKKLNEKLMNVNELWCSTLWLQSVGLPIFVCEYEPIYYKLS